MMMLAIGLAMAAGAAHAEMLDRPDGQVAYEVIGSRGQIVLCAPGIGDVRAQYRFLAPALVDAGYRVVLMDLRGLGESTAELRQLLGRRCRRRHGRAAEQTRRRTRHDHRQFGECGVGRVGCGGAARRRLEHRADRTVRARNADRVVSARIVECGVPRLLGAPRVVGLLLVAVSDGQTATTSTHTRPRSPTRSTDACAWSTPCCRRRKRASEAKLDDVKARVLVVMGSRDPDFANPADEALLVASV